MVSQEDKSLLVSGPERLLRSPTEAVIFDNDGVIVDTEKPHWWPSIRDTLAEYGVVVSESERAQFQGQHPLGDYIVRTFQLEEDSDIVYEKIKKKLELSYATKGLSAMPGAVELIKHLSQRFPLAVASSSPTEHVIKVLEQLGIKDCFKIIIGKDNTKGRGKPRPDIFLQAAVELGVVPKHCVVFEDAESGILAAKSAGMSCIAVPNPFRTTGAFGQADFAITNLQQINLSKLSS